MGIPVRDVLRRKGTPYDELGLDDPSLTDDAAARRHDGAPDPHQPADRGHAEGREAVPAVRDGARYPARRRSAAPSPRRTASVVGRTAVESEGPHRERCRVSDRRASGLCRRSAVDGRLRALPDASGWRSASSPASRSARSLPGLFHVLGDSDGGAGQYAGGGARLADDHADAAQDRSRRRSRQVADALARHRRHGRRQLAGKAVLDGAARPGSSSAGCSGPGCPPDRSTSYIGGPDPAGRRPLHGHGVRLVEPGRRRAAFHARARWRSTTRSWSWPSRRSSALLLGLSSITVPWDTLLLSVVLYIVVPVIVAQLWRARAAAHGRRRQRSARTLRRPGAAVAVARCC